MTGTLKLRIYLAWELTKTSIVVHTSRDRGGDLRQHPTKRPVLLVDMTAGRRRGKVDAVPPRKSQYHMFDRTSKPRVRRVGVLVKEYPCRGVVTRSWAGAGNEEKQKLPADEDCDKLSYARHWKRRPVVFLLPCLNGEHGGAIRRIALPEKLAQVQRGRLMDGSMFQA